MSKILVTGGAGYIGSVLIPALLQKNHEVVVVDNLMYGVDGLLQNFINKNFRLVRENILDSGYIKSNINKFEFIIHLAAIVGYPACKKQPDLAVNTNQIATKQIAELANNANIPILYSSTGSNYGHVESGICNENTPLNPISIYGETKTKAEIYIQETKNFLIFRFATAFGVASRMRLDLLINDFVFQAITNRNLTVYEKNFKRTFLHVRDIADNIIFGLENYNKVKNNIYNIGSNKLNFSKYEIAELIKKRIDFYLHYADFGKDEDQRNYIVDYTKAEKAGFNSRITIDEGIDELIEVCRNIKYISQYSNV